MGKCTTHIQVQLCLLTTSLLSATGFIGLPIAQAFVRAGHIVYGQTRSAAKAKQLAAEESKFNTLFLPCMLADKPTS